MSYKASINIFLGLLVAVILFHIAIIDLLQYYKSVSCIEIPEASTDFQRIVVPPLTPIWNRC